ncbi:MAG: hypothetical protein MI923_28420 [Phycisphaerales bacterium]|nr:hypothetical protein [Phycisphaerales bacterium]
MTLPGGSPGPNAEGSFKIVLLVFTLAAIGGGLFLWLWHSLESDGLTLYSF